MTEAEFQRLATQGYNRVPLVAETFADLDTPLSLYLKLANRSNTYLLESVEGGERFGRYSFIGLATQVRLRAVGRLVTVMHGDAVVEKSEAADPLEFVRQFLSRYRVAALPGLPRFCGGLVGYFGYDAVRWIEARLSSGWLKPDPTGCPDMLLLISEELAVIDNLSGKLYLVVYADPAKPRAWHDAQARLRELLGALRLPLSLPAEPRAASAEPTSNFGAEAFRKAVERAIRYVHDGDVMQVVLSQRLSRPYSGSPLSLYRALRSINPSPYMFYFDFGDFQVVGASPEILVRHERGAVTVRPIAGTRPRGASRERDLELERELLADPKERAEHVMLVDLGRNDVGRVAAAGSVQLMETMTIERYSQ
jgi:anthranilate synthase component 1